jgi:hypothetical protein
MSFHVQLYEKSEMSCGMQAHHHELKISPVNAIF